MIPEWLRIRPLIPKVDTIWIHRETKSRWIIVSASPDGIRYALEHHGMIRQPSSFDSLRGFHMTFRPNHFVMPETFVPAEIRCEA